LNRDEVSVSFRKNLREHFGWPVTLDRGHGLVPLRFSKMGAPCRAAKRRALSDFHFLIVDASLIDHFIIFDAAR
jgi:hypothetical protein